MDEIAEQYQEPDPLNSLGAWLDTVLPHPTVCFLFLVIAIFAKWEYILRIAVALGFCFGCVGAGLVFEWFRARNWKAWQEFDEDGDYIDSEEDDSEDESEEEDKDVQREKRYWEKRIARVMAEKKQGKLKWEDEVVVASGKRIKR